MKISDTKIYFILILSQVSSILLYLFGDKGEAWTLAWLAMVCYGVLLRRSEDRFDRLANTVFSSHD